MSPRHDPNEISETIMETVGRPVRSSSLFYTLYYLSKIEGVDSVEFEFKRLRDDLRRGFHWYGVLSIAREFRHIYQKHYVRGTEVLDLYKSDRERLNDYLRSLSPDPADPELVIDLVDLGMKWDLDQGEMDEIDLMNGLLSLHRYHSILSDPEPFVQGIYDVFNARPDEPIDEHPERTNATGWRPEYNGPAWAGIAEHLLRVEEDPPTMWVDVAFGIEHNNNNWFDGLDIPMEVTKQASSLFGMTSLDRWALYDATRRVLDANRAGNMTPVFECAIYFQDHIGINLKQLLRRMNLDP